MEKNFYSNVGNFFKAQIWQSPSKVTDFMQKPKYMIVMSVKQHFCEELFHLWKWINSWNLCPFETVSGMSRIYFKTLILMIKQATIFYSCCTLISHKHLLSFHLSIHLAPNLYYYQFYNILGLEDSSKKPVQQ